MSLLRTTRGGKPVDIALTNGGVLVGTAPGCQVVVTDPAAAPKHCRIARSPQGFVVTDLSGGGGTIVNGARIKEHVLRDGDVLQIGSEKFVFAEKKADPQKQAAGVAASGPAVKQPALKGSGASPPGPAKAAGGPAPKGGEASPSGRRPLPARAARGPSTGIAAARKLVAKPGSVTRVHKDHAVFSLPSTAKGRAIALSVGVGLVILGGVLFVASSRTVNSEDVKKRARAEVEALEAIPESEMMKRYETAGAILSNEDYNKYAKGEIQPASRIRNQLQPRVTLENRAASELKRFFEKYKSLKDGPPEEYNKAADDMYEQAKVHLENFKTTSFGSRLAEIVAELKDVLEKRGIQTWRDEIVKLSREVTKLIEQANFSGGLAVVDAFGDKYGEKTSTQLKSLLQDERDRLRGTAKSHVEKLKVEASQKSTKDEGRKLLEAALPFVKGFPDVEKQLERYIREFK